MTEGYVEYMSRHLRDPASADAVSSGADLRAFFERASAAGIDVGVVMFPAADGLAKGVNGYPFVYLHERARTICAEEGVQYLDLLRPFAAVENPRSLWVSPFDAHPSRLANERAAIELLQAFAPSWSVR
jgi:hypothetical protein